MTSGDQTPAGRQRLARDGRHGRGNGPGGAGGVAGAGTADGLGDPMALRVAVTLRLADFMPDDGTGEGAGLGDLAERAGADPARSPACCATWCSTGCSPSRVRRRQRPRRVRGDEPAHARTGRRPRAHHRRLLSPRRQRAPDHRGARHHRTSRHHRVRPHVTGGNGTPKNCQVTETREGSPSTDLAYLLEARPAPANSTSRSTVRRIIA